MILCSESYKYKLPESKIFFYFTDNSSERTIPLDILPTVKRNEKPEHEIDGQADLEPINGYHFFLSFLLLFNNGEMLQKH